ncbi:hypothetical protein AN958_05074 [Leucoagaricus sp. SymC.cos]|nr:hypothetical protein AN958_05074 [Leucoagaricus sp. SymC.cos]
MSKLTRPLSSLSHSSSSRSPRHSSTDPTSDMSKEAPRPRARKRIIVCCDGTWQDGISTSRSRFSNVLRLARAINHEDERQDAMGSDIPEGISDRPIQQIVFYQSGIGTDNNPWSEYVDADMSNIADKVEEAYAFIAHNYSPGDDIYLFGFSRGAYTARMVAMFIGEIGVLDRQDMDHFASIFVNFQRRGIVKDPKELELIETNLAYWLDPKSKGKQRVDIDRDGFTIKCVGVWDTVGALGLPDEIVVKNPKNKIFGFNDPGMLGPHIEYAFQALALDERRKDFNCNKFEQTSAGRKKGQVLKQVGGGYANHDLSDITLYWMAANVETMIGLDLKYLENHLEPVAKWGEQEPHDSATGIFTLARTIKRDIPTQPNAKTNETIHSSVIRQLSSYLDLQPIVEAYPDLVCELQPLEKQFQIVWEGKYDPELSRAQEYAARLAKDHVHDSGIWSVGSRISRLFSHTLKRKTGVSYENGKPLLERSRAGDAALKAGLPVTETRPPIP